MKIAFVTGVTGQDGAYLAEYLLGKGYKVYGGFRRTSSTNLWRLEYLNLIDRENFELIEYNLLDLANSIRIVEKMKPDEIYNLAAQSFVGVSFEQPIYTSMTTGIGATNLLEAIRIVNPDIKFYQASTSEMFGKVHESPQKETTPFYPRSPYGVAKLYAHWMTVNYREAYNIHACSGILFNHESPLRGIEFVTRKITDSVSKIKLGIQDKLELGNIYASRDWGYAKEYVVGMHKMLLAENPDDYVLATNKTYSIKYFAEKAFNCIDIDLEWSGEGVNEIAVDKNTGKTLICINEKYFRPSEVEYLYGDHSKAKEKLNWEPKTSIEELVELMVKADMVRNER